MDCLSSKSNVRINNVPLIPYRRKIVISKPITVRGLMGRKKRKAKVYSMTLCHYTQYRYKCSQTAQTKAVNSIQAT